MHFNINYINLQKNNFLLINTFYKCINIEILNLLQSKYNKCEIGVITSKTIKNKTK